MRIRKETRLYLWQFQMSGNMAADSITVSFQQPSFSLNGVAIDGYLNGASVVFRPTNPSMPNNLFMELLIHKGLQTGFSSQ